MKPTIADVARDILIEEEQPAVMYGDVVLLDMIGVACDERIGTTLCDRGGKWTHPLNRHKRILDALDSKRGQELFDKFYDRHERWRIFRLKD